MVLNVCSEATLNANEKNFAAIQIKIPKTSITNPKNSCAISEHYPLANKMKETDYDIATTALQQEMNLARRACWCNRQVNERKTTDGDNYDKDKEDDDEEYSDVFNKVTTVLNGATSSENNNENNKQIINNCNCNDSANDNENASANGNCKYVENCNDVNMILLNSITKTINLSETKANSKPSNTIKRNLLNNNLNTDSINATSTATNTPTTAAGTAEIKSLTETHAYANVLPALPELKVNIMHNARQQLQCMWLAFISLCDSITIKHNDPRFVANKQNERLSKKPGRLNLLTSKKLIFLFLACVFFSCLNRIEGRPNVSALLSNPVSNEKAVQENFHGDGITTQLSILERNTIDSELDESEHRPVLATQDEGKTPHDRYPLSAVDFDRVKTPFIIGIWILSASIAKIGFHMTPKLHLIFPESCLLIVVGVVIGIVLYFGTEVAVSPLTPNTFFFYMLPPIILDAGYFMPNRLFFDNLGTILLMAVVGTIFNVATIGGALWACGLTGIYGDETHTPKFLDTFLFASLISAVDPVAVLAVFEEIHVNEILYIVVFGESLLNDAVTVVMYHMMEVYNEIGISNIIPQDIVSGVGSFFVVAFGGTVIGIIWGFLTGLVTRFTDHVRVIEPIFIFVMAYLAYLNAEIFHMSGILAITFCGITMKNYVESNISQKSHTTVKYALKMLSSSSETIIFMFLGVATVNNSHVWNTWFVLLTIAFCSIFRVIGVIILTALANRFRLHKLSRVDQFVMSYGGLRGAVAFALVLLVDERIVKQKDMFVTTTIAVIYFTVFVQGITIKPLVKILNVKRANKRKPTMNERIHERFMDHLMAGIEDIVGKTGNYNVRDKFKRFDNRFIRPLLIRDLKGAEPKIIETYSKLTMRDAMEVIRRNPSTIGQITGTESMSALFRNYTNNCIGGSPSLTNLDNSCSRNLDMHELDYNPSKKDLTDAKIHHLLAEELKPYRRHRRLSYSRHAVDDRDLSTQVNYKMQMNFRRMFNDRKHHKRSKRGSNKQQQQQEGVKQNHVSFHDFQQNGTTKQFSHEENQPKDVTFAVTTDDWDDGLTFTAKTSLPENPIPEEDRNVSRDSDGERCVATPTATESQLPWKRQGDECTNDAVQQNEFPAWASNKEYLAYNSPSATFLGGINKPKQPKSVIGLFRRESGGSKDITDAVAARGSDPALAAVLSSMIVPLPNSRMDKRSQSISAASGVSDGHLGPFSVAASHRRNIRRGSMLELTGDTIPEEGYQHGHSKSLCEPADSDWDDALAGTERASSASGNSSDKLLRGGREPLLPKLTPRSQVRRMGSKNKITTALLAKSNNYDFDYDDDDDEDEDFDLYDDESIVVTTTTLGGNGVVVGAGAGAGVAGNRASSGNNTTTTIRLTRNNDESII